MDLEVGRQEIGERKLGKSDVREVRDKWTNSRDKKKSKY